MCIFWVSKVVFTTEIEKMMFFALKAHPLHDQKGCDLSKKNVYTVEIIKSSILHELF